MNQRCRALWGCLLSCVVGACAATVNPSTQDAGSPQDRPALTDLTVSPDQTTTDRPVGPFEEHIGSLDATDLDVNATDANATDLVHLDISDRPRADVRVDDVINLDAGPLPPDVDPFGPEIPVTPRGRRRLLAGIASPLFAVADVRRARGARVSRSGSQRLPRVRQRRSWRQRPTSTATTISSGAPSRVGSPT